MPPITRSHRQLEQLNTALFAEASTKNILFITGAGISQESGVPLYRSDNNKTCCDLGSPVWNRFVEEWCTVEAFIQDPQKWYVEFWDTTHNIPALHDAVPNVAHLILAKLTQCYPKRIRIITQNIDGLHTKAGTLAENLIEAHGRFGLYRCVDSTKTCIKSWKEPIWEEELCTLPENGTLGNKRSSLVRVCPVCSLPCMPMLLTFSDSYNAHTFFHWTKAKQWMLLADIIIFVGTSFSVTITDFSLLCSLIKKNQLVYSMNISPHCEILYNFTDAQKIRVSNMWCAWINFFRYCTDGKSVVSFSDINDKSSLLRCCKASIRNMMERSDLCASLKMDSSKTSNSRINAYKFISDSTAENIFSCCSDNINYLLNHSSWSELDDSNKDFVVNTARYNNVCRVIGSAGTILTSLCPNSWKSSFL